MADVSIQVDEAQLAAITGKLAGITDGLPKVMVGAVNDTVKREKTAISTGIRKKINIKKSDSEVNGVRQRGLDSFITPEWANPGKFRGAVTLSAYKRISLAYFGARVTRRGVTYAIAKGGGRKTIGNAFGLRPGDLTHGVFKRIGSKRLPIQKLFGPSPLAVFFRAGLDKTIYFDAAQSFYENINRRVNLLLLRAAGKVK